MEWWAGFLTSAWTLAIVPAAIAVSSLVAFWKTWLEKRQVELEYKKLQIDVSAATSRIVAPTAAEVKEYAFSAQFMRRAVRLGSVVLAVALPVTVALQQTEGPQPVAGHPPPSPVEPAPAPQPARSASDPATRPPERSTPSPERPSSQSAFPTTSEVHAVLARFWTAYRDKDARALGAVYPAPGPEARQMLDTVSKECRTYEVMRRETQVAPVSAPGTTVARVRTTHTCQLVSGGERSFNLLETFTLREAGGEWQIIEYRSRADDGSR